MMLRLAFLTKLILFSYIYEISAHELSEYQKHIKDSYATTVEEYVDYLRGKALTKKDALDCLSIKLDYLKVANEAMSETMATVDYYYQEDLIVLNDIIFGKYSKKEFEMNVKEIGALLREANKKRGKISEEAIFVAVLTRLFTTYEIWLGKHKEAFDLSGSKKCKDYKGRDHN